MKITSALNLFVFCGALVCSAACSQDASLQSCKSDSDCQATEYCALGGGVFFSTDHCVARSDARDLEPDADSPDAATTLDGAVEQTEQNDVTEPAPKITCDSVCAGEFPVCDEVRDECVVFVSPAGTRDDSSGLQPDSPVATLAQAFVVAAEHDRRILLVTGGDFAETMTLENGIRIYGGYDPDLSWERHLERFETRIVGHMEGKQGPNKALITVTAPELSEPTVLDGLTIVGMSSTGWSVSTIALSAYRSQMLTLQNMKIVAGNAGNGRDGALASTAIDCPMFRGGAGAETAPLLRPCAPESPPNQSGSPGFGNPLPGQYGQGGKGARGLCSRFTSPRFVESGSDGQNGRPGDPGDNGTLAASAGAWNSQGEWVILQGSQPTAGEPGGGGGGGGAGGHYDFKTSAQELVPGGNGGNGGDGTCGGGAGQNGMSGGSSFGLVAIGGRVIARNTTITLAIGGMGGTGSSGNPGLPGRIGEFGGESECASNLCGGRGGNGGRGGSGGHGGLGAGGHGGDSIGIATVMEAEIDIDASVVFDTTNAAGGEFGSSLDLRLMGLAGGVVETRSFTSLP